MKKVFLTSALCMLCALPSYADIASGASSATCDTTTIGATEGSTGLEAQWSANQYSENPGYYLLFANDTVSTNQTCTAGNYCPGFTNQTFADSTMGLNSCSTNDANFPNSAAGASAATDCYRACSMANMGTGAGKTIAPIAHATAISGNDYYGAGTDTCVPTACEAGYHVGGGVGPLAVYVGTNGTSYGAVHGSGEPRPNFDSIDPYDIGAPNEFGISFSDGTKIIGTGICSSTSGVLGQTGTPDTSETGNNEKYCWCQMVRYSIAGGTIQTVTVPSFVFDYEFGDNANCLDRCGILCANDIKDNSEYRSALFGELGANTPPSCVANTINITWYKQNGEANVENQCTYGGAVTIPTQPTKAGYTFGGWKVKTSNSGN